MNMMSNWFRLRSSNQFKDLTHAKLTTMVLRTIKGPFKKVVSIRAKAKYDNEDWLVSNAEFIASQRKAIQQNHALIMATLIKNANRATLVSLSGVLHPVEQVVYNVPTIKELAKLYGVDMTISLVYCLIDVMAYGYTKKNKDRLKYVARNIVSDMPAVTLYNLVKYCIKALEDRPGAGPYKLMANIYFYHNKANRILVKHGFSPGFGTMWYQTKSNILLILK